MHDPAPPRAARVARRGFRQRGDEPDREVSVFYWLLKRIILGPFLHAIFRPWVRGDENVPETGGAILASNHLSFSDSIFLPLVLRRRVTFLAKSDYFTGRGVKGRLTAAFIKGAGQFPVDRSGGQASEAALQTGLKVLRRGDLLGIYPEGTRSPDGRLYRGKTGVARLALEAGVPVLPVAMIGTDKVQPIGRRIPKHRPGRRRDRPAARLLALRRAWRTTGSCCGRSPTRSCTSSWSCPGRSTSTCTPPR